LPDEGPNGKALPEERPAPTTVAALLLLLTGARTAFYGAVVPFFPGLVDQPSVVAALAVGIAAVVASVAVFRKLEWGRWLGVGLAVFFIARDVAVAAAISGRGGVRSPFDFLTFGLDLVLLYFLLKRWRAVSPAG
jgi:hypothetical protein